WQAVLAYNIRGYEPISHGALAEAGGFGRTVRSGLAKLSFRLPLQKICTTDWLKQMVGDPRSIVIGHGIDLDLFHAHGRREPSESDEVVIGVIGRTGEVKGYEDFLRALGELKRELPIHIRLAGQDEVTLPSAWSYSQVRTPGELQMAEFYRSCNVFVFPSRAEGFGLPPLESMACGTAVIITDCGGVNTYARSGENCLMVPVADPRAMAAAIERLVADPALRETLVDGGFKTVRQFSRADVEARFCNLLESLAHAQE
ncbi:MAG: glycosyltransferase family 4 protein, partial [Chloroflexota bacterium]